MCKGFTQDFHFGFSGWKYTAIAWTAAKVFRNAAPEAASAPIRDAIQAPSAAPAHGRRPIPCPINVRDIRMIECRQKFRARACMVML